MKQQKRAKWTSSRLKGEKNVAEHVETDPRLNKNEKKNGSVDEKKVALAPSFSLAKEFANIPLINFRLSF